MQLSKGGTAQSVHGLESNSGGLFVTGSAANSTILGSLISAPIHFITNNSIKATIDAAGNVGIGTAAPAHQLTLYQAAPELGFYDTQGSSRNWVIRTGDAAVGDFSIKQSNAAGGNPVSAGTG